MHTHGPRSCLTETVASVVFFFFFFLILNACFFLKCMIFKVKSGENLIYFSVLKLYIYVCVCVRVCTNKRFFYNIQLALTQVM